MIRDPSHLAWIRRDLLEAMDRAPPGLLDVRIYCTRPDKCGGSRVRSTDLGRIPPDQLFDPSALALGPQRFLARSSGIARPQTRRGSMPLVDLTPARQPSDKPRTLYLRPGRPRVDELIESEIEATARSDWVRRSMRSSS